MTGLAGPACLSSRGDEDHIAEDSLLASAGLVSLFTMTNGYCSSDLTNLGDLTISIMKRFNF